MAESIAFAKQTIKIEMKPYLILGQTVEVADTMRKVPRGCMLVCNTSNLSSNRHLFDALQHSDIDFRNPDKFKRQIEAIVGSPIMIYKEGDMHPFLKYRLLNVEDDKIGPSGVWPIRAGHGAMMLNPYLDDPYSLLESQPISLAFKGAVFPILSEKTLDAASFKFQTETTQEILFHRLPGIYYNFSSRDVRHEDLPEPLPKLSNATSFRGLRSMHASTSLLDSEIPIRVHTENVANTEFPFYATVYPNKTPLQSAYRDKILMPLHTPGVIQWLKRQSEYTQTLSARDVLCLKAYSYKGDTILNNYLRGRPLTLNTTNFDDSDGSIFGVFSLYLFEHYEHFARLIALPDKRILKPTIDDDNSGVVTLETESFILANLDFFGKPANYGYIIEQYKRDLIRIISAAPRLSKPIVVYRGFKSEHISSLRFVNDDFLSTSLSYVAALTFAKDGGMYQMTLHAGVPCLFVSHNIRSRHVHSEFEVLVPPGLSVELGNQVYRKELIYTVECGSKIECDPITHTFIDVIHANVRRTRVTRVTRRVTKDRRQKRLKKKDSIKRLMRSLKN